MSTITILLLGLIAFIVILFYKLFFSQTDEIPTQTELKPLPPRDQTTQTSEPNPDINNANKIAPQQQPIFATQWNELAPKSIWGFSIAEPLRILLSVIIYPFVFLIRLLERLLHYTFKILKFILELIVEFIVEVIFNLIIRGIFFLIKSVFLLIFRIFDGI